VASASLPEGESYLILIGTGGGIFAAPGGMVRLSLPGHPVQGDVLLAYRPRNAALPGTTDFCTTGIVFEINLYSTQGGSLERLADPLEVAIDYSLFRPPGLDRGTQHIYTYAPSQGRWLPQPTTVNTAHGVAFTTITHSGVFGLFEPLERETMNRLVPAGTRPATI
jgi:hypothetical protein